MTFTDFEFNIMSENKKLSGAEYRKRAAKRQRGELELLKKVPKIGTFFTGTSSSSSLTTTLTPECQADSRPSTSDSSTSFIFTQNLQEQTTPTHASKSDDNLGEPEVSQLSERSSQIEVGLPQSFLIDDPATWNVKLNAVVESVLKNCPKQNLTADFTKSERIYNDSKRTLSVNIFKSTLPNGDIVLRDWLLYSQITGKVFCIACCLFQPDTSKTNFSTGFNDWKHSYELLKHHEQSKDHRHNVLTSITRQKSLMQVDKLLFNQYKEEVNYWRSVFSRIVSVVKFLSVRGLPFHGDNEHFGSTSNGLYLGCLELISEYDPFLAQHISKYGNKGSGHTSYLSSQTCNEFIEIMGSCVLKTIIEEVKEARYFALIVDSTPDCAHVDQLAVVLRYVPQTDGRPVERLIKLLPGISHASACLENAVLDCLKNADLNIKNCRGQSYDNASNMSGPYSGLQARIKQHSPQAEYVPCAAHSLNLVGSAAAECCTATVVFFGFVQELYNYFSPSAYRWSILKDHLAKNNTPVVKSLSETRWSARTDAVKALAKGYKDIQASLKQLSEDPTVKPACRFEAQSLETKFQNFETSFLLVMWSDILERVDKCSNNLQSETLNLEAGIKQLKTLEEFLNAKRNEFDVYEQSAISIAGCGSPSYTRVRKRKVFADETRGAGVEGTLDERTAFKNNVFLKIIDSLIANLARRRKAYEVVFSRFEVLSLLLSCSSELSEVERAASKLCKLFPEDISSDFPNECVHFKMYVELENFKNLPELYSYIKDNNLASTFPNLEIVIRMFLTLPVTNCTAERTFSVLIRVKNVKRASLLNNKLNSLVLMCTEKDVTLKTNFSEIVDEFAKRKCRRRP